MADRDADRRGPLLLRPLRDFLHTEAAGGAALLLAAVVALIWANSPWQDGVRELWPTRLAIDIGGHGIDLDLQDWINDGLMAIFFFVVGLEIKRELVEGELRDPRRAALPAIAAAGGMLVPALIYTAFNAGGAGSSGWGIPVATDIAVAVGVRQPARIGGPPGAQAVPAGAGDRRRHRRHRDHRRLLLRRHRLARRRRGGRAARGGRRLSRRRRAGDRRATSCSASACGWPSTSRASTPRSPASSSAC